MGNIQNLLSTKLIFSNKHQMIAWIVYWVVSVCALTFSPYQFAPEPKSIVWLFSSRDFIANIFLLTPIGFVYSLLSKNVKIIRLISLTIACFVFSSLIELTQLLISNRSSQYWDIIANSFGAVLGIVAAIPFRKFIYLKVSKKNKRSSFDTQVMWSLLSLILISTALSISKIYNGLPDLLLIISGIFTIAVFHSNKLLAHEENSAYKVVIYSGLFTSLTLYPFLKHANLEFYFLTSLLLIGLTFLITLFLQKFKKLAVSFLKASICCILVATGGGLLIHALLLDPVYSNHIEMGKLVAKCITLIFIVMHLPFLIKRP